MFPGATELVVVTKLVVVFWFMVEREFGWLGEISLCVLFGFFGDVDRDGWGVLLGEGNIGVGGLVVL